MVLYEVVACFAVEPFDYESSVIISSFKLTNHNYQCFFLLSPMVLFSITINVILLIWLAKEIHIVEEPIMD